MQSVNTQGSGMGSRGLEKLHHGVFSRSQTVGGEKVGTYRLLAL